MTCSGYAPAHAAMRTNSCSGLCAIVAATAMRTLQRSIVDRLLWRAGAAARPTVDSGQVGDGIGMAQPSGARVLMTALRSDSNLGAVPSERRSPVRHTKSTLDSTRRGWRGRLPTERTRHEAGTMNTRDCILFSTFVLLCVGAVLALSSRDRAAAGKGGSVFELRPANAAQLAVLDRLQGTWDVGAVSRKPEERTITYSETYKWVLDNHFMLGETSRKSDGTQDVSMITYDAAVEGYRVWIFNSQGTFIALPPGTWNADTRSMEWKTGMFADIGFSVGWTFPEADTRRWTAKVKSWTGQVLLDVEGTARRRR